MHISHRELKELDLSNDITFNFIDYSKIMIRKRAAKSFFIKINLLFLNVLQLRKNAGDVKHSQLIIIS